MKVLLMFVRKNRRLSLIVALVLSLTVFNTYMFYDVYELQELQAKDNSKIIADAKYKASKETDPLIKGMWKDFAYQIEYQHPKEIQRDIQHDWTIIYAGNTVGFLILFTALLYRKDMSFRKCEKI